LPGLILHARIQTSVLSLGAIEDNLDHQPEAEGRQIRRAVMEKKCLLATIFMWGAFNHLSVHDGF
jgi:hypothetical protein